MADLESFSASMVELGKKSDQLDQQLSVEQQRARALQLSASSSAENREILNKDIHMVMSELCELEMEAEDLASLQPQEHATATGPRPGQKGVTATPQDAMHTACNVFVAACCSFKHRHRSLQQDAAAAEAQSRFLNVSRKISEAREALASAKGRHASAQEQLGNAADACNRTQADCEELRARLKGQGERRARLEGKQERLEREQRKALEEAEKELCASTLQDEAVMDLQKEIRTLNQQTRREESTGVSLRNKLKSKEDELAKLRRSLQALSGPAQLSQPTPAALSTSAVSDNTDNGNTGIFCESNQAKGQQQTERVQQCLGRDSAFQRSATQGITLFKQPRPVISLVSTSLQQRSHNTAIPLLHPRLRRLSPAPCQPVACPRHSQGGAQGQASLAETQHSSALAESLAPSQAGSRGPGKPLWQQRPPPQGNGHSSTQQHAQNAAHTTLRAQPGSTHMQKQVSRSAGEVDERTGKTTAELPVAAVPVLLQHQGAAKQPARASEPAMAPSLEPSPYTVQEPDSPPPQGAQSRQGPSAASQAQMPPTCVFMETTITRVPAQAESSWMIREVHAAGESAAQSPRPAGFHTHNPHQQGGRPLLGVTQSFYEGPAETNAREHHHPRPDSPGGPARGEKRKAGGPGRKARGPRKKLKRILGSDDEYSLALYQPDAADKSFKQAQLTAEEDVVLSSLW